MIDAIGRGPFPTTGNNAADAWIRDARGYIGIVANRCRNCLQRSRCRDCYSLEANKLVSRHDSIRFGKTFEMEVEEQQRLVVAQVRAAGSAVRGDVLKVGDLKGAHKTRFLMSMCAEGLLVKEVRITGASGHHSLYYSLPKKQNATNG